MRTLIFGLFISTLGPAMANISPDWSNEAMLIPGENRANIYQREELDLEQTKTQGYIHAMKYPVTVTGLLIPYKPLINFMHTDPTNPLKKLVVEISRKFAGFRTEKELY